jgi:CheY-like chemotaxis protein
MSEKTLKIVVIDDDKDDIELFLDALHEINDTIECIVTHSCRQAFNLLEQMDAPPDVIFLDINMPVQDGRSGLLQIKKMAKLKNTIVVMHSTSITEHDKRFFLDVGAQFLLKQGNFKKSIAGIKHILLQKQHKEIADQLASLRVKAHHVFDRLDAELMESSILSDSKLQEEHKQNLMRKVTELSKSLDALLKNHRTAAHKPADK